MPELTSSEILCSATEEVLETMFYTTVLGDAQPVQAESAPPLRVRVCFQGSPSGALGLSVTSTAARTIAGNFLGVEGENALSAAQIGDVVCELGNMICGSMLSRMENEPGFAILHPELLNVDDLPEEGDAVTRSFELGDGVITVSLRLQPSP